MAKQDFIETHPYLVYTNRPDVSQASSADISVASDLLDVIESGDTPFVTTAMIKDDAVTADKIADNAVDSAQIKENAVITAKISDEAVTTAKIADAAVTADKLAPSEP